MVRYTGIIEEYFLNPMGHHYTTVGSLVYGILFIIAAWLAYKHILKRMRFRVDSVFMLSLVPFIIFGGITRALRDAEFYQGFLFVSPGIYVTMFVITLASLLASMAAERHFRKPYWWFMLGIGSVLVAFDVAQVLLIGISNWDAVLMILGLFGFWAAVVAAFQLKLPHRLSRVNASVLYSHLMDGSQNFVALGFFGYTAQKPVTGLAEGIFGPWVIFPLKIIVILGALLLIDKYSKDAEFNWWLKIAILILGLPMGFRGMFRLGMGV